MIGNKYVLSARTETAVLNKRIVEVDKQRLPLCSSIHPFALFCSILCCRSGMHTTQHERPMHVLPLACLSMVSSSTTWYQYISEGSIV